MSQIKVNKTDKQERYFEAEVRSVGEGSRTIEISWSSEEPVQRWYGSEILSHDASAIDLQRLKDVGVVLFAHGRDNNIGKMPIAKIDDAWLDETTRKCRAKITFDDDEDSDKVFKKVEKGFIKGVSFGYNVSSWEEVMPGAKSVNGRFDGPSSVGIRWEPFEISVEPTPADSQVGIGRSLEDEKPKLDEQNKKMFEIRKKINGIA